MKTEQRHSPSGRCSYHEDSAAPLLHQFFRFIPYFRSNSGYRVIAKGRLLLPRKFFGVPCEPVRSSDADVESKYLTVPIKRHGVEALYLERSTSKFGSTGSVITIRR
ncbi:hypothetical protein [Agrobacterium rosae]|uniref:hypothetical protein n=1 Tax=Agrobacterium rosae TaxID=1972867 RepID=UPI003A7F66E0